MKRLNPTMQRFTRCMLLILCLSILYVLLMMMAYVIPDSAIMENRNSGIQYLDSEGERPLLIFRSASSMMDNFTDKLMLTRSVNEQEMRLISRAMFPNYARYWNGYQVLLRPLLMVANYSQIRTMINAVCIFLLIAAFCQIRKSINTWIASAFVLSMLLVRFIVVSVSMQYASCFIIMMIAMIVMLRGLDKGMSETKLCLLFTVVGSVTNFVDLLTVPAITVGVPGGGVCGLAYGKRRVFVEKAVYEPGAHCVLLADGIWNYLGAEMVVCHADFREKHFCRGDETDGLPDKRHGKISGQPHLGDQTKPVLRRIFVSDNQTVQRRFDHRDCGGFCPPPLCEKDGLAKGHKLAGAAGGHAVCLVYGIGKPFLAA